VTGNLRDQLQATLSGTHTLERELGGGGMSKVFVAEETRLKRKVVVKVLSPELAQGISIERFEREIQTVAALQQANIVGVLSAGETNGLPFYTMPFVEGESLRARLGRGPMAATEVIGVLRDVSKALAYAHQRGVVHRDIKPDNVLISGGTAVVTDFGIAKALSASRTDSGAGATLTQIGTSIGTPAYMAPEQAAGDPDIDHRADIYALGAMAYELLSGQSVFANRTPQRMLAAHMSETPKPITDFRNDLPPVLADLVMQCLAKEADARPQQAGDIARVLETITSGSGMQSMPPVLIGGPGMLRKALAVYAGAFVAVAILAKAAIVGIGLPDWVFPGSLIVMALGLPVVLWTGYVQRVARRAMTMTPTFTPGGSPSVVQGTIATMAMKAAPRMSWYKTARGGMYAMGTFTALIAVFMAMRAFGIGPFGSLLASGALKQTDKVLLTDFTVSGGDSTLGRVVSDAVRAGLNQSSAFTIVTPAELAGALRRMERPLTSEIDLPLARQLAQREGIKAIIDGNVATVAGSYIVAVRLITADSGRELTSHRATAAGADQLIAAADEVARQMRSKAGESLRKVQNSPPLARMTTASVDALRKYGDAVRAADYEGDYVRAIALLREVVAMDTLFAEGWRKLAVVMGNQGIPRSQSDSALMHAYALRERLPDNERDRMVAYYYSSGPGRDRAKAIAAYEAMLARGDSSIALNNLALLVLQRREFGRAEELQRAAVARNPESLNSWGGLMSALSRQGRFTAADSVNAIVRAKFPDQAGFRWNSIQSDYDRGRLDDYRRAVDSARRVPDTRNPSTALWLAVGIARDLGQLRQAGDLTRQANRVDSTMGRRPPPVIDAVQQVSIQVNAGMPADNAVRNLEAALVRHPLDQTPLADRPYFGVAGAFGVAGYGDRARAIMGQYRAAVKDTAQLRDDQSAVHNVLAAIAWGEKRWLDVAAEARASERKPDGPAGPCVECLPIGIMEIFAQAEMADSAIAAYDDYKRTPMGSRPLDGPDMRISADLLERLAKMYELKNDTAHAAEFYRQFIDRWKDADPELQPRVSAAREKLRKLTPVERPKP